MFDFANCAILTLFTRQDNFTLIPEMNKSKEVTRENFAIFLRWLSPQKDKEGGEYERLRFRLTTFFAARRCPFAEELADEVINRLVVHIVREAIENKLGYIYGVARKVYLESLRKEKTRVNIDDLQLAAKAAAEPDFSVQCLNKCLKKLPSECREMVLDYFSQNKSEKIAAHRKTSANLQINATALRMRVWRIKRKLAVCVKNCIK